MRPVLYQAINLMTTPCPLCAASNTVFFSRDKQREYWQCTRCKLVFVPPAFWVTPDKEREQYDLHENNPVDEGYRRFLSRVAEPLLQRLQKPSLGLDFGCGPGPTLSLMLEEYGHSVALYDKFYFPNACVWQGQYHFITATEVFEHLHDPLTEIEQLWQHLLLGGYLVVMTKRVIDEAAFSAWHYKNDPTHIIFFSNETFAWLAARLNAGLEVLSADVVLFTKL